MMTGSSGTTEQSTPVAPTAHEAFRYCEELARRHYENFPVASFFLPRSLRPAVVAIYAFARTADDFADEGDLSPQERLRALDDWEFQLDASGEGRAEHPVFVALAEVMRVYGVPKGLLSDLLTAFRMDVTTRRYTTFKDVLRYCRYSANPVGRIILHLFAATSDRTVELSDNICTALQLANFWQDVRLDCEKGRIYIPLEDMERFGYTESDLFSGTVNDRFRDVLRWEIERTRELFNAGRPLVEEAMPELRFELKLTWHGGMRILDLIEAKGCDVFRHRPSLGAADKLGILFRSLFSGTRRRAK